MHYSSRPEITELAAAEWRLWFACDAMVRAGRPSGTAATRVCRELSEATRVSWPSAGPVAAGRIRAPGHRGRLAVCMPKYSKHAWGVSSLRHERARATSS